MMKMTETLSVWKHNTMLRRRKCETGLKQMSFMNFLSDGVNYSPKIGCYRIAFLHCKKTTTTKKKTAAVVARTLL